MADARMKIIIEALNLATAELKDLQKDLGDVEKKTKKADSKMDAFAKTMGGMLTVAAAIKFGKMAYELGVLGAQAERTEQGFETISGGADNAAENLEAMMIATDGAIDRTTAMAMANQMMMMGIADSSEALAKNAEMATRLGRAMGVDAIPAMQNWNAMMANQSLPRLDTYGISSGKVRARINELMASIEGLTREQAFNTAVMEQGQIALDRLGPAVDDNALAIEQSTAAFVDLKVEMGIVFAEMASTGAKAFGTTARSLADQLILVRGLEEAYGKAAVSRAYYNTVYEYGSTLGEVDLIQMAELHEMREQDIFTLEGMATAHYAVSRATIDLGENVGDSAAAWDQYSDALIASEAAGNRAAGAEAELARQTIAAKDAAIAAESAFLDSAAALGEMSDAAFVAEQLKFLTEAVDAGTLSEEAYNAAKRELLVTFGLLTPAEEEAQEKIGNLTQKLLDGTPDVEAYALALRYVKNGLDGLYSKDISVRVKFDVAPVPSYITDSGQIAGGRYQTKAAGGVSPGGLTMVGERGPELVNLPGGSHVYNNQVTNNFNNTINTRATAGTYLQDIAMARSMMSR